MTTVAAPPEGTGSRIERLADFAPIDTSRPSGPASPAWIAPIAGLLVVLYGSMVLALAERWMADPNYSHGFLVPLISGWLVWRWRRRGAPRVQGQPLLGSLEMTAGGLLHLAATVVVWPPLDFVGLLLVLRGMALVVGGRNWAAELSFPGLFLFFMFPLPVTWTGALAIWLQEVVSWASAGILDLMWVCHRSGHSLFLAGLDQPLVVAEECSGLRQIIAFVALAALIGHLSRRTLVSRMALLLAAVPVAIGANVLRVLLMAIGARCFGAAWLATWLHDAPALVTLPFGLALLVAFSWLTGRRSTAADRRKPPEPSPGSAMVSRASLLQVGVVLAALGILQSAVQWHLGASAESAYPGLRLPLDQLPLRLPSETSPAWAGEDSANPEVLRRRVPFADQLLSRTYFSAGGDSAVHLYAVYSHSGADREHHPEICIRDVGGAREDRQFRGVVHLDAGQRRTAQRFRFQTGIGRFTTVYYWHYTLDPAPVAGQSLLQALHERLSRRAPSITVQVATDAAPETLGDLEQSFLAAVDRTMVERILPPTARIGCERLPIRLVD